MKSTRKLVFVLFLSILSLGTLCAQTDNYYSSRSIRNPNHVLLSPFYFFDGTFMLTYERLFNSGSLRITPSITLQNLDDYDNDQKEGWGIDVGYKFFFTQPRKVNMYMGPYAMYRMLQVSSSEYYNGDYYNYNTTTNYDILGLGVDAGVKFIFGRFTMDISLGGGIRYPYMDGHTFKGNSSDVFDVDYKGIVPRGNFSFGIAF